MTFNLIEAWSIIFGPKSNNISPTDYNILSSSQLTMSIYRPCYCIVHIYVVRFCESVWYVWVELLCRL